MNNEFVLSDKDVISMSGGYSPAGTPTSKVEELKAAIRKKIALNPDWFDEGVQCETLRPSTGDWQKGRFKVRLELVFMPDQPEETETSDL